MTTLPATDGELTPHEDKFLTDAAKYLEYPSLLTAIANLVGWPMEKVVKWIEQFAPETTEKIENVVSAALRTAVNVAVSTIRDKPATSDAVASDNTDDLGVPVDWWHKLSVAATGTIGGLFGLPGLVVELPISTTVMLRSIASAARDCGETLDDPEVGLQCLAVLAHGGPNKSDDAMESSYLTTRLGLQLEVREAAKFMAKTTAAELAGMIQSGSAPILARLLARIAAEFNVTVTQKMLAQSIPVIGAVGGAAVNVAFIDHFHRVARFHFGIRSLERKYGMEKIQAIYLAKIVAILQATNPTLPAIEPA